MSKCIDGQSESKIHAYELGLFSGDELTHFEQHLMDCSSCFEKVTSHLDVTRLLRFDPQVRPGDDAAAGSESPPTDMIRETRTTPFSGLKRLMILAAVLVIIAVPVFKYVMSPDSPPGIVQQLELYPLRSEGARSISLQTGGDAEIKFVVESIRPSEAFRIQIASVSGEQVYQVDNFDEFNEMGLGIVTIPVNRFEIGNYQLLVIDPSSEKVRASYHFRVE